MKRVNIHEAKTQLSRHLRGLKRGERIILCRRNVPIAEIHPLTPPRKRSVGLLKGQLEVPPEFFAPLPDEVLEGFEGGARR